MRGRDELNCPYCSYCAELKEWLKPPWSPFKGGGGAGAAKPTAIAVSSPVSSFAKSASARERTSRLVEIHRERRRPEIRRYAKEKK